MTPFPNYKQLDSTDCGPTCLKIVAKYYGRGLNSQYLRKICYKTRTGVSMLSISEAAEHIGLRTLAAKITFSQIVEDKPFPCILHWNQNHFVVCYGVSKGRKKGAYQIKISDPAGSKYKLDKEAFLKCWIGSGKYHNGMVLLLNPTPKFYQDRELSQDSWSRSYFLHYLIPYKSQVFQLAGALLLGSFLSFLLPFLAQAVVDQGITNANLSLIKLVLIAQLIIFSTQLLVDFFRNSITLHINNRVSISMISDFLLKLMRLPLKFFDTRNVGDIMQRIGDNNRIKFFLTGSTLTTIFSFSNFIVFSSILAFYSLKILGIFLFGNALYFTWILIFMRYRRKLDMARFTQASTEQSRLIQIVTGMQDIKLNNCERQQRWKWESIQVKLFKINLRGLALGQYQQLGSVFFSQATSLLISFISAESVIDGDMTLGMMMSISYITAQMAGPVGQLIGFLQSAQDAKISMERLKEIHGKEDEVPLNAETNKGVPANKTIQIQNVSFSYDGGSQNNVLENLNLCIPQNKITAIVGASGSGKTTLLKLLLAFYTPNEGKITMGDTALNEIDPHLLRKQTGVVLQDGFIFSDTITNNIAVGIEEVDFSMLSHAVTVANIKDYIESLPLKYNTKIGMEGNGISQGQRQRILIARAVYKNPSILFFDEATNALDANNEKVILDNLNDFYKGRTVVIVAHRLSTVSNADNIIVIDKGRVIEQGSHLELTKAKGTYYNLVKNQLELSF